MQNTLFFFFNNYVIDLEAPVLLFMDSLNMTGEVREILFFPCRSHSGLFLFNNSSDQFCLNVNIVHFSEVLPNRSEVTLVTPLAVCKDFYWLT